MTTQTSAWQGDQSYPTRPGRAVPGAVVGGRYRLRAAIGTGGMGTVWQASDTVLNRDVAVKEVVLPPGMAGPDRSAMYERTLREARAAAALSHPSVVQVYDVVTEDDRPWIIMELLAARSLADMIISDGPLNARAVAKIGVALLGALEVAHSAGVLHRDVKPANVLICTDGRCVLTDFGVARMPSESNLTTPGMVLGSPHFISPERAVGGAFGPPSDLFSLGVTLFTAVEGRPPFDRGDPFDTMRAVVEDPPARMLRAGTLAGVLTGLLEKDPSRRWDVNRSRAALRDLLDGVLANPAVHHVTDPYAVVAPAPPPPRQEPPLPTGRVGGRAMISPGGQSDLPGYDQPTQNQPDYGQHSYPQNGYGQGGYNQSEYEQPDYSQTGYEQPGRADRQQTTGPVRRPSHSAPVFGATDPELAVLANRGTRGKPGTVSGKSNAGTVLDRLKRLPRSIQVGTAAALVLLLGLTIFTLTRGDDPADDALPLPSASATADQPLIADAVLYTDKSKRYTLNVPKSWNPTGTSYIDFTDANDKSRRLRVNVENAGSDAGDFLHVAENNLKKNGSSCPAPYHQVGLREDDSIRLSGQVAAELEYTCGSGDAMRHGIWRATVMNGKAYEFFLTVPDSKFDASKPVYDEAVRSYRITVT